MKESFPRTGEHLLVFSHVLSTEKRIKLLSTLNLSSFLFNEMKGYL